MFDLSLDPFAHFTRLYQEACEKKVIEANAMTLATVDSQGQPSARILYYKGMVRGGFSFYTNYNGRKAQDISANSKICLNFYWPELWQQVRIDGVAEKMTRAESEAYFKTRARLSQLGAWASQQSEPLPSYDFFQKRLAEIERKFAGQEVPCPPNWGGFRVEAKRFEFWFGHDGRLHERFVYEKTGAGWQTQMLFP